MEKTYDWANYRGIDRIQWPHGSELYGGDAHDKKA